MSGFELNKIFAAVLCASITVMLVGYTAETLISPEKMEKDAVPIDGSATVASSAPAKPKLPDPIMGLLAEADIAKGAKISKACAACHSFDKGGPLKQGPNLWNIVGAPKGAKPGFSYSDALIEKGGVWDYNSLNRFMAKPKRYIPGTKMNFAGIKKAEDRAALIAWLRQQAGTPEPLPTEEEISAEEATFNPPVEAEEKMPTFEVDPTEESVH